jgi:hypothetical protein
MNEFELNIINQELNSFFSSNYVETKIKNILKISFSEFNQRLLLGIQDITYEVVEDFKNSLKKELQSAPNNWIRLQNTLEIVPNGTRYLGSVNGNEKVCVVEYAPTLKTLYFDVDSDMKKDGGIFRLAFPYVVFIVKLIPSWGYENGFSVDKVYIGYRTRPLQTLNDKIYCANLPNCDIDHHICLGRAWDKVSEELKKINSSLSNMVEGVIGYFWNSKFNDDLADSFIRSSIQNDKIKNLKTWQENSIKDPLFVLNLEWGFETPISNFLHNNNEYEFRLNVGTIADRVVIEASQKLNEYLKTKMQVTISNQKSFDIIKKELHESLIAVCGKVLSSSLRGRREGRKPPKTIENRNVKI